MTQEEEIKRFEKEFNYVENVLTRIVKTEKRLEKIERNNGQLDALVREKIAEFYKLTCLNEDGDIENNGYYISEDLAKLAKDSLDKEPRNNKYGIKQNIIKCEFSD